MARQRPDLDVQAELSGQHPLQVGVAAAAGETLDVAVPGEPEGEDVVVQREHRGVAEQHPGHPALALDGVQDGLPVVADRLGAGARPRAGTGRRGRGGGRGGRTRGGRHGVRRRTAPAPGQPAGLSDPPAPPEPPAAPEAAGARGAAGAGGAPGAAGAGALEAAEVPGVREVPGAREEPGSAGRPASAGAAAGTPEATGAESRTGAGARRSHGHGRRRTGQQRATALQPFQPGQQRSLIGAGRGEQHLSAHQLEQQARRGRAAHLVEARR